MQNIIKPQKNKERAFTVLELLVVIAIIGLLSMITLMSLSSATFRGRDTKTIQQLSQIPSALSLIYASEGEYNDACLDEDNFSIDSGLRDIQLELSSRNKTIKCFANGDNYCISSQLNDGNYYLVKNDLRFTDEEGCTSATIGGGLGEGNVAIIPWACEDVLLDERNNKEYTTVEIGTQCWMAENLNIGTRINGENNQGTSCINIEKYCYNDNEENCAIYGGLYQWNQTMCVSTIEGEAGICPMGWHIPTDAQWHILESLLTDEGEVCDPDRDGFGCSNAGLKMKTDIWGGNNSSGFTALPAGFRGILSGSFLNSGSYGYFWSSLELGTDAYHRSLNSASLRVDRIGSSKMAGLSVRCIKD